MRGEPVGWFFKIPLAEFRWRVRAKRRKASGIAARLQKPPFHGRSEHGGPPPRVPAHPDAAHLAGHAYSVSPGPQDERA
jgi:hypothetical protein